MKFSLLVMPLLMVVGCHRNDPAPANPASLLPPATQTGANSFGCLVNGQPWIPSGNNGTPNLVVTYDPNYLGGALQIKTYRYSGAKNDVLQGIVVGAAQVNKVGDYTISLNGGNGANYIDNGLPSPCNYYGEAPALTYRKGKLTITKLDLTQGIISGTLAFTLYQPGCDSVRVTNGRFDKKL